MAFKLNFIIMIQDILLKWGIPTYVYSVETLLAGGIEEKIGDTLEVTVGWVYGVSINTGGKNPDNSKDLIDTADLPSLYLNLKYGQSIYINKARLDHFVFHWYDDNGVMHLNTSQKYLPVNIPVGTDLKQSTYSNPTSIANKVIMINLFYIDINSYNFLLSQGLISQNGQMPTNVRK